MRTHSRRRYTRCHRDLIYVLYLQAVACSRTVTSWLIDHSSGAFLFLCFNNSFVGTYYNGDKVFIEIFYGFILFYSLDGRFQCGRFFNQSVLKYVHRVKGDIFFVVTQRRNKTISPSLYYTAPYTTYICLVRLPNVG